MINNEETTKSRMWCKFLIKNPTFQQQNVAEIMLKALTLNLLFPDNLLIFFANIFHLQSFQTLSVTRQISEIGEQMSLNNIYCMTVNS